MAIFSHFSFAAARPLPNLPAAQSCRGLHGHRFRVDITLAGELEIDTGSVVGFDDVDRLTHMVRHELDQRARALQPRR